MAVLNFSRYSLLSVYISLHIPVGMYGLLGENGAGKTTLMRILATLLEPSTGTIEINGIDIKRKKEIRKIIGYLPQEFSIYPNMTVHIPQELRIRSRGTERHSASN